MKRTGGAPQLKGKHVELPRCRRARKSVVVSVAQVGQGLGAGQMTEPGDTVRHLSSRLSSLSTGRLALVALALFVLFMIFVLPTQAEESTRQLAGAGSPDMSFIYSADVIYGWAEAYGVDGRAAYVRVRWSFDLVWPVVYGFFLVTAISWVGRRAYRTESRTNLLNLVPLAAVLLDYTENVLTSMVMLRYPMECAVAATLASPVTVVKWLLIGGSFIALIAGVLAWIWRLLRGTAFSADRLQRSEEVDMGARQSHRAEKREP